MHPERYCPITITENPGSEFSEPRSEAYGWSAEVLAVEFADSPGQGGQQFVRKCRNGVNDRQELTLADDENDTFGIGDD
jgi:hypothetical protein